MNSDYFTPETLRFRRQWKIGKNITAPNNSWLTIKLPVPYTFVYHPDLNVCCRKEGDRLIIIAGTAINTCLPDQDPLDTLAYINREEILNWLEYLAGRYVVIYSQAPDILSIFTDPSGFMGIFYNSKSVASTPALLVDDSSPKIDVAEILLKSEGAKFPGDLCAYRNISALMANHELQFCQQKQIRFWPTTFSENYRDDAIEEIAELLTQAVKGICRNRNVIFSLTGGQDTRTNLAAARIFAREVPFFTIRFKDARYLDTEYSRLIAEKFSLKHRVIDPSPPPDWLLSCYDEIGANMCKASDRKEIGAIMEFAHITTLHVGGVQGEVLRAFLWPRENPIKADSKLLIRQTFNNFHDYIIEGVEKWYSTLPSGLTPSTILDLYEFEQRAGRLAGIREACSSLFFETVPPLNSRLIFKALQAVPKNKRYRGILNKELIRIMWPDLLSVPFTSAPRPWWRKFPRSTKSFFQKLIHFRTVI
ncbi:MAG: hypothetical protein GX299_07305 [Epulopiscium sp.]|nr:hypothetical protein [Candidatus Epulonipiscium sp.]